MEGFKTVFVIGAVALFTQCRQQSPDTRTADEAAIRQADINWSKTADLKDLDGIVSYYTEDSLVVLPPNSPIVIGKEAARELNRSMISMPGYSVKWKPDKVEVARSGDIGYVIGSYELTVNDSNGVPTIDKGKYVEIWKKQTDGSWKVAVEMLNSNLPIVPVSK